MPLRSQHKKARNTHKKKQNIKTSRGLVRIIAGTHRARRLPVLVHDGLRPTGDRVKETLFNWLMGEIEGAVCLDMYAGSGSLGIEALSRGAKHVVFIEQDKTVAKQINDNLATLRETDNARVLIQSALSDNSFTTPPLNDTQPAPLKFDIVFIDPPFGLDMVAKSIEKLINEEHVSANGFVYIETGHNDQYQVPVNFELVKQIKTSQVLASLYQIDNSGILPPSPIA